MAFYLNQSTIKKFIKKGSEISHCPRQIYYSYISREFPDPTTDAMLKGKYFESKAIMGTAHGGDLVLDLPRKRVPEKIKKKNPNAIGDKTVAQIRIDEQVEIFKQKAEQYGVVYNEYNTQVKIYKRWHENPKVILSGELDIFPTVIKYKESWYLTIVDLKLTGSIANTFGDFSWADFDNMDHLQALHYLYLLKDIDFDLNNKINPGNNLRALLNDKRLEMINNDYLLFIYWIFDYKPKLEDMFKPFIMNNFDLQHYYETIRKAIAMLEFMHTQKYPPNPNAALCSKCNVKNCEFINSQFK